MCTLETSNANVGKKFGNDWDFGSSATQCRILWQFPRNNFWMCGRQIPIDDVFWNNRLLFWFQPIIWQTRLNKPCICSHPDYKQMTRSSSVTSTYFRDGCCFKIAEICFTSCNRLNLIGSNRFSKKIFNFEDRIPWKFVRFLE